MLPARQMREMAELGLDPGAHHWATLARAHCRAGDLPAALEALNGALAAGVEVAPSTWAVVRRRAAYMARDDVIALVRAPPMQPRRGGPLPRVWVRNSARQGAGDPGRACDRTVLGPLWRLTGLWTPSKPVRGYSQECSCTPGCILEDTSAALERLRAHEAPGQSQRRGLTCRRRGWRQIKEHEEGRGHGTLSITERYEYSSDDDLF